MTAFVEDADVYRRKADELLKQATAAKDMAERSRLIAEAAHWHWKATESAGNPRRLLDGEPVVPFREDGQDPKES